MLALQNANDQPATRPRCSDTQRASRPSARALIELAPVVHRSHDRVSLRTETLAMKTLSTAALALVIATHGLTADAQPPHRFMGGPVTLEDQGSFFVGGVTKITEHASTQDRRRRWATHCGRSRLCSFAPAQGSRPPLNPPPQSSVA